MFVIWNTKKAFVYNLPSSAEHELSASVMAIFAATSRCGGWKYDDYRVSKLLKLNHFVVNEYYIILLCCSVVWRTLFTQFGAIEAQYDSVT